MESFQDMLASGCTCVSYAKLLQWDAAESLDWKVFAPSTVTGKERFQTDMASLRTWHAMAQH